jgi:hypothetical protein
MDEESARGHASEQQDSRSKEDRRVPEERRRGRYRLLELHARRDGEETDRRQSKRRGKQEASRLSFLWRWAKN